MNLKILKSWFDSLKHQKKAPQLSSDEYKAQFDKGVSILLLVKENILPGSDLIWTSFDTVEELQAEIDKCIFHFKNFDIDYLDGTYSHFIVTSTFQEHSMANGWSPLYLELAEQFDHVYNKLETLKINNIAINKEGSVK